MSAFSVPEKSSVISDLSPRMLCTTITQSQRVRLNRCHTNEVMTGIQSLEPLWVYCTTLLANCRQKTQVTKNE